MKYPVIIIGMHRSGTTLLTNILQLHGLAFGQKKEYNQESILFLKINERLLKNSNATWYNPDPYLDDSSSQINHNFNIASSLLKKNIHKQFGNTIHSSTVSNHRYNWGWKDPRNTITLDIWMKIFPEAKIIHIYRNPVDVAVSLREREKIFLNNGRVKSQLVRIKNYIKFGLNVDNNLKLLELQNGFNLWKQYISQAFSYDYDIYHVKYEELLSQPHITIKNILNFIEHDINEPQLSVLAKIINNKYVYKFTSSTELVSLYSTIKNEKLLNKLGYNSIINDGF